MLIKWFRFVILIVVAFLETVFVVCVEYKPVVIVVVVNYFDCWIQKWSRPIIRSAFLAKISIKFQSASQLAPRMLD